MPTDHDRLIALENENQQLRLRVEALEARLRQSEDDLERARYQGRDQTQALLATEKERLLSDAAAPAAQLLAQAYLLEQAGKTVAAADVLSVSKRLVKALQNFGLAFTCLPGEPLSYDPAQHAPLDAAVPVAPGATVIARLPGVSFGGKILRKALVEKA